MSVDTAHKSWWQIGEVIFGTPLLAAVILQLIAPLQFINESFSIIFLVFGIILCIGGITLIIAARQVFSEYGQPTDPGSPTHSMVTTSVFSVSRNPMYLGTACLLLGIALVFNLAWVFIFFIPTLVACRSILIAPEERYLEAKFGAEYHRYATSVFRWIGHRKR